MSNELTPIDNSALPQHAPRATDVNPASEKRAEQQVAILFGLSAVGSLLLIYSYIFVKDNVFIFIPIMGNQNAQQLGIGIGMAMSLFFIGIAAIHWAKTLMPDKEIVNHRHEFRSSDEDRAELVQTVKEGVAGVQLGRRKLIKRSLGVAAGLFALPPVLLLRDLGPLPGKKLETTNWKAGTRLLTDPGNRPILASDLEVGAVVQVLPAVADMEHRPLSDIAKDPVLLIRLRPEEFQLDAQRLAMTHEGIIAFSKICSHMGCAVALYEQTTKHLLCPCHQSTFDVTRAAKVIFGPAARPLPQLDITVDAEGYLVARAPFNEAVGPSFWERNSQ
ncbi:MAG: ubiquinol-cytochrome C reductase [Actinobacteria bacterium]|nr:ubiquinol-cytochrome C reductase [Actinomycetota bacterium]NDF89074.1 ubiquinol-cytochrome C reductase [Actinomycetota bacterium]